SRSTWMPCGNTIMPAPKLLTSLPVESNFRTGSNSDILPAAASQQELVDTGAPPCGFGRVPHRSPTHTDLPSLSMSTALVDPHSRPAGSFAQPSIVLYGFGASLVGGAD